MLRKTHEIASKSCSVDVGGDMKHFLVQYQKILALVMTDVLTAHL